MHCVLSLFCDGRVVEIFILRLVHLESGIFMMVHVFFFVQVGSTESVRNGLVSFFVVLNEVSLCVFFCLVLLQICEECGLMLSSKSGVCVKWKPISLFFVKIVAGLGINSQP